MSDWDEGRGSDAEQESCRQQIKAELAKKYRNTIRRLEEALARKEKALKNLRATIEFKNVELRRLGKSNRKLIQTLSEERSFYSKEKERFCNAMIETKRSADCGRLVPSSFAARSADSCLSAERSDVDVPSSCAKPCLNATDSICAMTERRSSTESQGADKSSATASAVGLISKHLSSFSYSTPSRTDVLETAVLKIENRKLRSLVEDFDERNHELCMRYFRMKQCKDLTWNKLRQVDEDYLETLKKLLEKFNELRGEFNTFAESLKPVSIMQEKYLKITQDYYNMAYEYSSLKLEMQCLRKHIDSGLYGLRSQKKCEKKMTEESLKRAHSRQQSRNIQRDVVLTNSDFYMKRTSGEGEEFSVPAIAEPNLAQPI